MYTFCVLPDQAGLRLDKFLALHLLQESRSQIQNWLEKGCVKKNGIIIHQASYKVKEGEAYQISPPPLEDPIPQAEKMDLDIIYEDEDLLVINKAAGMVVHPAPGHAQSTLVNALLAHCGESLSGIGGVKRPGIVHRLDKDTSGLMVVAKNDFTHKALSAQFHPDEKQKENSSLIRAYKAFVLGQLPKTPICVETYIGRHPTHRQKMAVLKQGGKWAITQFKSEKIWTFDKASTPISLLDCTLKTGRTHQIRVHCQHLKCYMLGDETYGKPNLQARLCYPTEVQNFKRQALHAYHLSFIHPRKLDRLFFKIDLSLDLTKLLSCLDMSFAK